MGLKLVQAWVDFAVSGLTINIRYISALRLLVQETRPRRAAPWAPGPR